MRCVLGKIRDVEYGHAEYVHYYTANMLIRHANKQLVNSENWSVSETRIMYSIRVTTAKQKIN